MVDQSTADTLNKALDLAKQGVVSAFETVKQYAPQVWAMARRQTIIEGYELIFCWVIGCLAGIALIVLYWKSVPDSVEWDVVNAKVATIITLAVLAIFTIVIGINVIDLLGNPDWWTMQKVLHLVGR